MPDNTLPKPEQVLGGSKLPSPNQVLMSEGQANYEAALATEPDTNQFEQVLTNIPDINEAQKSNLRKLALNVKAGKATHEDLRDTILTYQNKNPKQDGSGQYYITENMTAKPLASGERPPKGYDVANDYFGTQEEADKKGFLASAGSHLYNGVLKGVLGLETVANLPYAMATGEDADWYKAAQNRVESSLMKTPSYETEQELFDTKDLKGIGDFFDSDRYNFTKNTVQGAALSGLESITSFLLGSKGFGAAGTALSAAGKGSKLLTAGGKTGAFLEGTTSAGVKAQALGGAYAITLPEVLQYVDDAGIKGTDKYRLAAAITVPMALTEMIGGTEALFAANAAAKQSKSAVIRGVVDAVKRNADGPLTKEFLTETFKATTKEAAQLNKSFMRELGENVLGEAATEGLQEFEKQGLAELYDHISKEDNFKNDPLSLQAFGEYYNSALQGGLGSIGAGAVGTIQKRSIDLHEKQSGNVFEVVKKGEEAVGALKENIAKSVQDGEITQDQAAELIFKVDAYDTYNKQTSGIPLEDADKKKVFELTFEKSNLDSQIPTEYEQKDLNGIEQAKIDAKKKQAKDIQSEINDIIQKAEVMNKTTTAAKKTVEDVDKKIESETEKPAEGKKPMSKTLQDLTNKYRGTEFETMEGVGKPKAKEKKAATPKFEGVPFEEIKPVDWNDRKHKHEDRFKYLVNKLSTENDNIEGKLIMGQNKTVWVKMPGDKNVITASSAINSETGLEFGHVQIEHLPEGVDNHNVIIKPLQLSSGKTVLGVYSTENGQFLSYVREHEKGASKPSEKETEELQHLQAASKLTKAELEYYKQKRNQPPTDEGEAGATENVPTKPVTPTSPEGQTITNETTETGPVTKDLPSTKEAGKEGKKAKITTEEAKAIKEAVNAKPNTFEEAVLRYFLHNGRITAKDFTRYLGFGGKDKEFKQRIWAFKKDAPSIDNLVKTLWLEDLDFEENNFEEQDLINEFFSILESVIGKKDALAKLLESKKNTLKSEEYASPEAIAYAEQLDAEEKLINERDLSDEEIQDLLTEEQYREEAAKYDAEKYEGDKGYERDVYQKPKTTIVYHGGEITSSKDFIEGKPIYVSESRSQAREYKQSGGRTSMFLIDKNKIAPEKLAYKTIKKLKLKPLDADWSVNDSNFYELIDDRFEQHLSEEDVNKLFDELKSLGYEGVSFDDYDLKTGKSIENIVIFNPKETLYKGDLFQQKSDLKGNIDKVVDTMKAAVPNVKIVYDENLTAAGKWSPSTKTITINPYYAGLDTPIHEVGHILIDAMGGMKNKVINNAINQLKGTDLWNQTKQRYPELNNEQLGYEVLAEAIGMEGAGIFDKQADKNIFMQYLEYIFDWLKRNLGLEKNIARNLAKQIIAGIGTKDIITEGKDMEQIVGLNSKLKEEAINDYHVAVQMENEGKDPSEIRLMTNWERGVDGKWRYEIGDTGKFTDPNSFIDALMSVKPGEEINLGKLSDIYDFNDLYELYPNLFNGYDVIITNNGKYNAYANETDGVVAIDGKAFQGNYGTYIEGSPNFIPVGDRAKLQGDILQKTLNLGGLRKLLGHELQHLIQTAEGFIRGGNYPIAAEYLFNKYGNEAKMLPNYPVDKSRDEQLNFIGYYILSQTNSANIQEALNKTYKSLAGEVEANNVQNRFDLTEEERRNVLLSSSADISKESQILLGLGDVFQKEKGKKSKEDYKEYHVKSEKQRAYDRRLNKIQYRKQKFGAFPEDEVRDLNELDSIINDENSDPNDVEIAAALKAQLMRKIDREGNAYSQYLKDLKVADLYDKELSEGVSEKRLAEIINDLYTLQPEAAAEAQNRAKMMLAYGMFTKRKEELKKNEKFVEAVANKSDITGLDVKLLNLGHMTEAIPELQSFSKMFDKTHLDMAEERKELKHTFETLGTAVIKEANKKLGITGKALSVFSSDSAKYFEYLDDGKGNLLTEEQAKAKGLSQAQIAFLKNYRDLIAERYLVTEDLYNTELEVLKTDPTFAEAFKANGIVDAMSHFLGNSYNLKKTRIQFKNPNTGINEVEDYQTIENEIIKYGKKGTLEKAKAVALLIYYNRQARAQLKKGVNYDEDSHPLELKDSGEYSVDYKGELVGKFGRPRDKNRGYSKDFYRAGIEFIDELTHTKHMSPLVPVINGIEFLNEKGFKEHAKKPEVVKWIQDWRDMHLFKNTKQGVPEIDAMLKFLRFMTSATTMMFNVPASAMNLAMGIYNNWRAENAEKVAIGHKRLFGEIGKHKVNKDYAYGTINPYAVDILRKFDIVSIDYDSNPKQYIGRIFENLGHGLTRYGEFQIQGSMFLGQMTPEEYNSFEYKKNKYGVDELVVKKGVDEEALKEKLISYKNRVSDIQGKYGDKDRRNIMNTELGKATLQFKVWIPDYFKERFGKEYINSDGETVRGTWKSFYGEGLTQLRKDIKDKGAIRAFWEDKGAMSNLKGLLAVATLLVLQYQDDDDEKKKRTALSLDSAMGNLLFIFDPDQLKYTLKNPVAAVGTAEKFINLAEAMLDLDAEKAGKAAVRLTPAYKVQKSVEEISRIAE